MFAIRHGITPAHEVKTIIGSCYQDSPTAYDVIHGYPRSGDHGQTPLPLLACRSQRASVHPGLSAQHDMDESSASDSDRLALPEELRACLRAIIKRPLNPGISVADVDKLVEIGLVVRWGKFLSLTQAGRRAAFERD
jgi:hypothetical protein